ncbi:MAG: insulinase family protein [Ignavibacteriaceae bacterium]|nr:insulinase family protein [Ignavibacteriaceae bacterium]
MNKILIMSLMIMFALTLFAKNNSDGPVLLQVKADPTVSIKVMFFAGSQNDPVGKEGLAFITSQMLSDGSTEMNSYETILEKLYPLAAGYRLNPSVETATFSGRVHKDNIDKYYPLFMDALLHPAFKEEDFNRIKSNALNYLNTTLKYSSDEELGKAVLYNKIFEGTPYGHIISGTTTGISSISLDDVKKFYKKYYNSSNFILGIGGGFNDDFVKQIQNDLAKLPAGEKVVNPLLQPETINGLNVTIVNKQASATAISFGFPIDVLRGQKEWYPLALANSWMGEHRNSSSHLYQVIRESRGLNYGDYSYIENFPNGGSRQMPSANVGRHKQIFEIWIRPVPNETRHFVLRAAISELKHFVENGLTKDQFELTKNFLSKYILHYAPSTSEQLGFRLDDVFYGINGSHLEMFKESLKTMTLEDVNSAIKKHLQFENIDIAIVTNDAEDLKAALVQNTESPIKYATPKSDKVYEQDKTIEVFPLEIKAENVKIVEVEQLFK